MFVPAPVIWVRVDPAVHANGPVNGRPWCMPSFFWRRKWWPVYRWPHSDKRTAVTTAAMRLHYHIAWNRLAPSLRRHVTRKLYNTAIFAEFVIEKKEAPALIRSSGSKPFIRQYDRLVMIRLWKRQQKEK